MTDAAYPYLKRGEDLFKNLVWDQLIETGLLALYAYLPGLGIWPIRPILSGIIKIFGDKLFEVMRLIIDMQAIVFVNEQHKWAFNKSVIELQLIAKDKGINSNEFKKARDKAKVELAKFVHFGAA